VPFTHQRTIRFADTDAAGVVYFANTLSICHEAYEESLIAAGIELNSFFKSANVIVPIAKSEADYRRPLACGDRVRISVAPAALSENSYEVRFEMTRLGTPEKVAAVVRTEHVCLDASTRKRVALPPQLAAWVARPT
jgi:1,4-dihydroxy-2-naphthoyl-CoA hydrolase